MKKGFSLIELLIGLIIISCVVAAFTPMLTKKINSNSTTINNGTDFKSMGFGTETCEGYFRDKLGKTLKNCTMCLLKAGKEQCLSCYDPTCSMPKNYTNIPDCVCTSCKTTFGSNCCGCDSKECKSCIAGKHLDNGTCRDVQASDCSTGNCYTVECDNKFYNCPDGNWCQNGINYGQCDPNCKTCATKTTCQGCKNTGFYINTAGKCTSCPANATCNGAAYSCNANTYNNSQGGCIPCPANAVCNGSAGFSCLNGYQNTGAGCTFIPVTFNYTGGLQYYTVPYTGTYRLEAWGAQGGNGFKNDSPYHTKLGGYTYRDRSLSAGTVLTIVVGGMGGTPASEGRVGSAGYNGGGCGGCGGCGGGGGATHIFNQTQNQLEVGAGGGGGGVYKSINRVIGNADSSIKYAAAGTVSYKTSSFYDYSGMGFILPPRMLENCQVDTGKSGRCIDDPMSDMNDRKCQCGGGGGGMGDLAGNYALGACGASRYDRYNDMHGDLDFQPGTYGSNYGTSSQHSVRAGNGMAKITKL